MNAVPVNYCKNWRQVSEKVPKSFDNIEGTAEQRHLSEFILPISLCVHAVLNA